MSRKLWSTLGVAGAVLVVLMGAAVLGGLVSLPGSDSEALPACQALPSTADVDAALRSHPVTTQGLESSSSGVRVSTERPCTGRYDDRAVVRVEVPDEAGRTAVHAWLATNDGYGVPLVVRVE